MRVHISFLVWISDVRKMIYVFPLFKWYPIKYGITPLWIAAGQGHLKVVEYLVAEAKVDPNQQDKVLEWVV